MIVESKGRSARRHVLQLLRVDGGRPRISGINEVLDTRRGQEDALAAPVLLPALVLVLLLALRLVLLLALLLGLWALEPVAPL